jgi:hypothetical protein
MPLGKFFAIFAKKNELPLFADVEKRRKKRRKISMF